MATTACIKQGNSKAERVKHKTTMKFLIIYATTEGKHESFMEDELKQNGHKVTLADASDQPPTPKALMVFFMVPFICTNTSPQWRII
jgi:hypothetical protein